MKRRRNRVVDKKIGSVIRMRRVKLDSAKARWARLLA